MKPSVKVHFAFEREAVTILKRLAPGQRAYGKFLSRLLYEENARREERERIRQQRDAAIGAGDAVS